MILLEILAWGLATLLSIPLLTLSVECAAALWPRRERPLDESRPRPNCCVLIPAHNEGANMIPTLESVQAQLAPGDRILVVADNCTDNTAEVARAHEAEVVERTNPDERGKGYALAYGRDALREHPPAVVVVVDADCLLAPDALPRLLATTVARNRPAQAAYTMTPPADSGPALQIAAFAFLVKNVIRPLGLKRLGCPCLLTGTGMAFPWPIFQSAPLASGHIVEDMNLTIDLALQGHPPAFAPDALVTSEFPTSEQAVRGQRRRWEHGHLSVIRHAVPRLLGSGLACRRVSHLALAVELAVPPLAGLVVVSTAALVALAGCGQFTDAWGPATALAVAAGLATVALTAVWGRHGRTLLPTDTLPRIPGYVVSKLRLYTDFFRRPQYQWVRTDRADKPSSPITIPPSGKL